VPYTNMPQNITQMNWQLPLENRRTKNTCHTLTGNTLLTNLTSRRTTVSFRNPFENRLENTARKWMHDLFDGPCQYHECLTQ